MFIFYHHTHIKQVSMQPYRIDPVKYKWDWMDIAITYQNEICL